MGASQVEAFSNVNFHGRMALPSLLIPAMLSRDKSCKKLLTLGDDSKDFACCVDKPHLAETHSKHKPMTQAARVLETLSRLLEESRIE
mmetsp:Transcript_28510/g.44582  ORF Transcript_28510/g.44582 Transcript_28510/m.44582 type:complete len:88 (+) Transcript_28510:62-325(+)